MTTCFPVSLGAVDSAWLTEVLRAARLLSGAQMVDGFETQPIGLGFGQTGESARLTLRYAQLPHVGSGAGQRIRKIRHQ